jgi:hypothetical protein
MWLPRSRLPGCVVLALSFVCLGLLASTSAHAQIARLELHMMQT